MPSCDLCAGTGETDQPGYNADGSWKTERCVACNGTGNIGDPLSDLRKLAAKLPATRLRSDWRGTNHYELTTPGEDDWWLMVGEGIAGLDNPCETGDGKRLGLMMDIVAEVSRLRAEGVL